MSILKDSNFMAATNGKKADTWNRFDFLGLTVTIVLILCFCQEITIGSGVPFFRDLATYFYPMRYGLYESYQTGDLPLWNRHMGLGFPLLANFQSGVFYPLHLTYLVMPFFAAINATFVFHFLIAGVGTYCLSRSWNQPVWLSIVGALLFALGGTIVSLTNLLNHFQAAVWFPLVVFFWERVLRIFSWKRFLAFTFVSTVQFLAGSPELFMMTMILVAIHGLNVKRTDSHIPYMRLLTVFLFGNLLVVMLVMVQLLPTAELLLESRRLRGIPYQEALFWSLSPSSLANLFLVDKEFDPGLPQGLRLFFTDQVPFLLSHYLGAVSLFGFCFWLFCSSKGEKLFLLGLAALSVVMAFGAYTPVYPFVYRYFPILSVVRYPEKFFFITYIVLLYMVFSGLSRLCALDHRGQKTSLLLAASNSLIWIGLYVVLRLRSDLLHDFIVVKNGIPPFIEIQAETTAAVLASIEKQFILSSVIFCLIYLLVKKLLRASLFGCLLIAIVFVDLAMAHRALLFPLDPKFVERGPGILRHPDRFLGRLFYYRSTQNLDPSSFMGEGQPLFQEVIALTFQDLLPNSGTVYGFDYMQEIDAISRWPYREFLAFANRLEPEKQIRLLRALNVSYLVSFRPLLIDGITLVARFPKYFSWLYKVDKTLPRAYVVNSMSVARVPRRIFERLSDPRFDPTREVILDQAIAIDSKCRLEGHAVIRHYEDRRVTVETSLNDTGILILADSFYPGWKAYVDGREEPIRRANLFFRAVLVAAGNHRVEFRYEPRSFAIGLAISIATLVALMMTVAVCYLRERKGKKSSGSSRESLIRTN